MSQGMRLRRRTISINHNAFYMPSVTIPPVTNRYILIMIGYGVIILAWLTPEGAAVWPVVLLGMGLTYLSIGLAIRSRWGGRNVRATMWIPGGILLGAVAGLVTNLTTFFLMLMKNAQHGHAQLDFPNEVTLGLLELIPYWMAAGLLLHLALVLVTLIVVADRHEYPTTILHDGTPSLKE